MMDATDISICAYTQTSNAYYYGLEGPNLAEACALRTTGSLISHVRYSE